MIIGLSGYARTGKDTVANYLVDNYGFTKVSFAQPMRDALYALNPRVNFSEYDEMQRLRDVIDAHGWDNYKETEYGTEIRELMQRLGTEVGREQFGQNFWVDQAMKLVAQHDKVVLSDVRFPNEQEAIRNAGGLVWRIHREGVQAANGHASETALDNVHPDLNLMNNEDVESLHRTIDVIMGRA